MKFGKHVAVGKCGGEYDSYSALGDIFAHLELKRRESNERKAVLTTISVEQHSLLCAFVIS